MTIDLLIIATNKYISFLPNLIESARKNFITNAEVKIHVFTDRIKDCDLLLHQSGEVIFHEIEHKAWPNSTLFRFHFFQRYFDEIHGNYVFYIDADTIIKAPITDEILSPITVVEHCGFVNGGGSWETNPESTSFVFTSERIKYYGGGFYGFDITTFKKFCNKAVQLIEIDQENGIIPVWHDESVLNYLLTVMKPKKVLSPSYHWPENNPRIWNSWKEKYECKILLLDKDHKEFRK